METNQKVAEILVKSGAYKDLSEPVILTGGDLGTYFINTEKIVGDDGEWKVYGDNPQGMIQHAINMVDQNPDFKEVIEILADKPLLDETEPIDVISGGQRRDWLFSGPVAYLTGKKNIALFKNGRALMLSPDAKKVLDLSKENTGNLYGVHISDLMTRGSSAYDPRNEPPTGWIPMLRERCIDVDDLIAVVDRLQGGRDIIGQAEVHADALVYIDGEFMNRHSKQPEVAKAYLKDPRKWSENYIRESGIVALVGTFDPKGEKLDRCVKFLRYYDDVLRESGRLQELEKVVKSEYDISLDQIEGGN